MKRRYHIIFKLSASNFIEIQVQIYFSLSGFIRGNFLLPLLFPSSLVQLTMKHDYYAEEIRPRAGIKSYVVTCSSAPLPVWHLLCYLTCRVQERAPRPSYQE